MTVMVTRNRLVEIRTVIDENVKMDPRQLLNLVSQLNPLLPQSTLFSIVSQRLRSQCAQNGKRVNIDSVAAELYNEYKARAKREPNQKRTAVIPQLARDRGFYPWMTFRACLQVEKFIVITRLTPITLGMAKRTT